MLPTKAFVEQNSLDMHKIIIPLIVTAIAIFIVVVAIQPAAFKIVRSAAIAAPPALLFAQVNGQETTKWVKVA